MTVREAFITHELPENYILMDIHKRAHFNIQDCWNYEIDHIEARENFSKAIIVMKIQIKRGFIEDLSFLELK